MPLNVGINPVESSTPPAMNGDANTRRTPNEQRTGGGTCVNPTRYAGSPGYLPIL